MTTEKQSTDYPADLTGKGYNVMTPMERQTSDAYFDERWPLFTTRNLLAAAGIGAGARGLYHVIRHFAAQKPSSAHQNFYGGPKSFADAKKKQPKEKVAETTPVAPATPATPPQPPVWHDPRPGVAGTWMGLGNVAGGALATVGGAYLMDKLVRMNKHKKYQEEIDAARREYENALGEKVGMLHEVYDANQEKIAENNGAGWINSIGDFVTNRLPYMPGVNQALKGYNTYATGAAGLSAALAGKIVYDLTRQRSQAEVLRRAQDARARMSSLPPLWVTPDDVVADNKEEPVETEAPQRKAAWSDDRPGGMYGATAGMGLAGAGLGGVLGGIYGAAHPGEEISGDSKKQRSRLMGALRGLAAGGAIGGGLGAGVGLGIDANAESAPIEVLPGVSVKPETIDAGVKKVTEGVKKVQDTTDDVKKKIEEARKAWGF